MLATDCEVGAEGRAAMDAGNEMGPEGAASLAPVLEKMTHLTSLNLGCARARFWARPRGAWEARVFGACCWGTCLDSTWRGGGTCFRAGDACDGLRGVC